MTDALQQQADRYLDHLAKSQDSTDVLTENNRALNDCGGWMSVGTCGGGHSFGRILRCGREWCPSCGLKDSDTHQRRWARWLPKVRQLRRMGYLVVTFPLDTRASLRTKPELRAMATAITKGLKELGFDRGLRRWHWFGDESVRFNPHLNFLLDAALISKYALRAIKSMVHGVVGVDCDVHYEWTTTPRKMVHLLKYVTRSTFTSRSWDEELAQELYRFRTTWVWGKWDQPPAWSFNAQEEGFSERLFSLKRGLCPTCGMEMQWGKRPLPSAFLAIWSHEDIQGGYVVFEQRYLTMPDHILTDEQLFEVRNMERTQFIRFWMGPLTIE